MELSPSAGFHSTLPIRGRQELENVFAICESFTSGLKGGGHCSRWSGSTTCVAVDALGSRSMRWRSEIPLDLYRLAGYSEIAHEIAY